jgi:hypothetical protein
MSKVVIPQIDTQPNSIVIDGVCYQKTDLPQEQVTNFTYTIPGNNTNADCAECNTTIAVTPTPTATEAPVPTPTPTPSAVPAGACQPADTTNFNQGTVATGGNMGTQYGWNSGTGTNISVDSAYNGATVWLAKEVDPPSGGWSVALFLPDSTPLGVLTTSYASAASPNEIYFLTTGGTCYKGVVPSTTNVLTLTLVP